MTVVPTLSTDGWLTTVDKKADKLLSYFFLSEHSQSVLYYGSVVSLPYLIATHGSTPDTLRQEIGVNLGSLLSSFFEDVKYNVKIIEGNVQDSTYDIVLSASVVDKGERYDLSYLVKTADATMKEFIKISNG